MRFNWLPSWHHFLLLLVATVLLLGLFFFRLGTLVPSFSGTEVKAVKEVSSVRSIIKNPINLPHKGLQHSLVRMDKLSTFWLRSASAALGVLSVVLFYFILKQWYTTRVSILGTLLFGSSPLILHFARSATPAFTQLFFMVLIGAYGLWQAKTRHTNLRLVVGLLLFAISLYTPGLIWFLAVGLIWQRHQVLEILKRASIAAKITSTLVFLACLVPLSFAFIKNYKLVYSWLGAPETWPHVKTIAFNLVELPLSFFAFANLPSEFWLGRLPLLNIFVSALCVLGAYVFLFRQITDIRYVVFGALLISTPLIAINGPITHIITMPFIYLLSAAGLNLLLQRWLKVFPRNPLIKPIGPLLIGVAVLMGVFYGLKHYFIAWPNSPQTKAVFSQNYEIIKKQ